MITIELFASESGRGASYTLEAQFDPADFTFQDETFATGPIDGEVRIGSDSFAFAQDAAIVFLEGEPEFEDTVSIFTGLEGGGQYSELSFFAASGLNFYDEGIVETSLQLSDFIIDGFQTATFALLPEDPAAATLLPSINSLTFEPSGPGRLPPPDVEIGEGLSVVEARKVAYLYEAGLDRDGDIDLAGLNFWIDAREDGLSEEALANAFLGSNEFAAAFGAPASLSDRDLVEVLYRNVLNREGETAGIDFWSSQVDRPGFSRADLLLAFAVSPENLEGSPFVETLEETSGGEWAFVG